MRISTIDVTAERPYQVVVGTGALGSFTTWSTVTAETYALDRDNGRGRAGAYLAVTLVGGVGAAWAGLALAGLR